MLLQGTTVDAVVLDMAMPGLDGFAVHARLSRTLARARFRSSGISEAFRGAPRVIAAPS